MIFINPAIYAQWIEHLPKEVL